MLNKHDILRLLDERNIAYELTEHAAVYTMDEVSRINLPYPEYDAKNLFVRDKKRRYFLITVKGDKRVDLKAFRAQHNLRALSFASEAELLALMGLGTGAVTPFGLLNDADRRVTFYLDKSFLDPPERIGIHPNDNAATVWLRCRDLLALIDAHGSPTHIVEI